MLFNSYAFLLAFLPLCATGFFLLGARSAFLGAAWMACASIFFYAWWDYRYVPLLLGSITFNYWCAFYLRRRIGTSRKKILTTAISANLALLAYYKYAGFFAATFVDLTGSHLAPLVVILPIGISFFTFTQIAYLVDTYQGKVNEGSFVHYILFVTYFPHLIAGPVLHHKEMMPQFADRRIFRLSARNIGIGASIFVIGLAKKVLIADNISAYASPLFNHPVEPSFFLAWGGTLAYAFQLYFDFSGYSDMAIGLSRLFGVQLPLNFDSPYKSRNIVEFWRRWHMTLSRFLRDYLYIPLGGNRGGSVRRHLNLMITMVLGGLWHGAGWNFVIWGFLHGVYLVLNHLWRTVASTLKLPADSSWWRLPSIVLTFVAVCSAWVFFRAPDMGTAMIVLKGMYGYYGIGLPDAFAAKLHFALPFFDRAGIRFYLGGGSVFVETWTWILIAAVITFCFPNTQEVMRHFEPALDFHAAPNTAKGAIAGILTWAPSRGWAITIALLAIAGALSLNRPADFLYYQF